MPSASSLIWGNGARIGVPTRTKTESALRQSSAVVAGGGTIKGPVAEPSMADRFELVSPFQPAGD